MNAHRLGDDHPVGRHHEPDRRALGVAQQLVHRDQVLHQPLDLAERALVGELEIEERPRQRPRRRQQRALAPEHLVEPPLRRVGERAASSVLAGRRAVDDDHVPAAGLVALSASRLNSSSPPGGTVAPRRDPVDAALDQHRAEPALHPRPVALELVLGLDLLGEQAAADVGRGPPTAVSSDSASECAGSVESTIVRAPAAQRRAVAVATDVFPTPPLPV